MCGLFAIYSRTQPIGRELVNRAAGVMRHRGPDHEAAWIHSRRHVALGHVRLAMIDLEGGHQPLANEDGSIRVVTVGEFYGYRAIRDELVRNGHQFRTQSDAEILPHLYEQQGLDCLDVLRGEFAFALWDSQRNRLIAGRDRFGIKSLYYSVVGDRVFIGSEVKALLAAGVDAKWNEAAFCQQLFACIGSHETLFAGIQQVPPGHYLVADGSSISLRRYWDLDYPDEMHQSQSLDDEATYIDRFQGLFEESVSTRLQADVPVTCFLSGGVDSSAVMAIAARHTSQLQAYTVAYADEAYDESPIAAESARFAGAVHRIVRMDGSEYLDHIRDAIWHAETLAFNLHGVARFVLCKKVSAGGFRAALSGEGADELLAGYGFARHDQCASRVAKTTSANTDGPLATVERILGFVPHWLSKLALSRSVFHLFLAPEILEHLQRSDIYGTYVEQFDVDGQLRGRTPLHQSLYLWARSILPNYVLAAERLEMANALEVRLPFLDHRLFEFVRKVPVSTLMSGGEEKYLLRRAARQYLTPTVYNRHKQPFTAPALTLTRGTPLYEFVRDVLSSDSFTAVPFFSKQHVTAFLDDPDQFGPGVAQAADSAVLAMVSACVLQDRFAIS